MDTGIQYLIRVAQMFRKPLDRVLHAMIDKQSNARTERSNGKIQEMITIARGFRNDENLRASILFFCGHIDLLPRQ